MKTVPLKMPRQVIPVTTTQIAAAKACDKLCKLYDGDCLHLRVRPNGKKTWVVEWRRPDGKLDTLTLGSFPAISLFDARRLRDETRTQIQLGKNPKEEREKKIPGVYHNPLTMISYIVS